MCAAELADGLARHWPSERRGARTKVAPALELASPPFGRRIGGNQKMKVSPKRSRIRLKETYPVGHQR